MIWPLSKVLAICCLVSRFPQICAWIESSDDGSRLAKRYYEHDVNLDDYRHDDQFFTFVTRPDIEAPKWSITTYDSEAISPGYWFTAPYSDALQSGADRPWNAPHIYDGNGTLIWSGSALFGGYTSFDFRSVLVQGKLMLSLLSIHQHSAIILDDTYQIHKVIPFGPMNVLTAGTAMNMHEFTTNEDGKKALFLTRQAKRASMELSKTTGFDGECFAIYDGLTEMDTETWEATHTWSSYGHIGPEESYVTSGSIESRCTNDDNPWDFVHFNSIDLFANGDWLVSGRRTSAVYRISRATGEIVWRVGGKKSDFKLPFIFHGQHSAKIVSENNTHTVISILDNALLPPGTPRSINDQGRGLIFALDLAVMTGELVAEFPHPENKLVYGRGNLQLLPNGNAWACFVEDSLSGEYTSSGELVMKARFRARIDSYRTFKLPWVGKPKDPPDVLAAVVKKNDAYLTSVHMSWNGATEVKEWKVYHTNADGSKSEFKKASLKHEFETHVWTEGYASHVRVEALDVNGVVLGTSRIFASLPPADQAGAVDIDGSKLVSRPMSYLPMIVFGVGIGMPLGYLISWALTKRKPATGSRRSTWWRPRSGNVESSASEQLIPGHKDGAIEFELFDDEDEDVK